VKFLCFWNDTYGNAFHPENPMTRSRACARCVCLLKHPSLPSLSLLTVLGKPRKLFPTSRSQPRIEAFQDPFLLSRCHSLARCFGDGLAALGGLGASAETSVVFAPAVGKCLCFAWVACTSGICFAFDLLSHYEFL
jgi:hypothetical protein